MKLSKPLLLLFILIWFAAGAWWYHGSDCGSCKIQTARENGTTSLSASHPLIVRDSNWVLSNPSNIQFARSSEIPVLDSTVTKAIDSLSEYTGTIIKTGKKIIITGYYASGEKNITTYENLGFARATAIKNILVAKKIDPQGISIQSSLNDSLYFTSADTLEGGITFEFAKVINNQPASVGDEPLLKPRIIYFKNGEKSIILDSEFENYLKSANSYMQKMPGKVLLITGYTDNSGDSLKNLLLSESRAIFVKKQLLSRGLSESKLRVTGMGMSNPIGDNNSPEGRAKNRRVTIVIN